jgi:hypothetical protein
MDFELIAMLFVAFSVISSMVNKWQTRQKQAERENRLPQYEPAKPNEIDVPKVDLSDWDVYEDADDEPLPPRSFRETQVESPRVQKPEEREFREVEAARPITESYTGPEYREVKGARRVTEADRVEFRDPLATSSDPTSVADPLPRPSRRRARTVAAAAPKKRKKRRICFTRNAMVDAVLYKEILGPPRGEEMPW